MIAIPDNSRSQLFSKISVWHFFRTRLRVPAVGGGDVRSAGMPGLFHEIGQAELSLSAGPGVQELLDDEPASGLVRGGLHAGRTSFPGSAVLPSHLLPNFPPGQAREVGEQPTGMRVIPPRRSSPCCKGSIRPKPESPRPALCCTGSPSRL